MPGWRSNCLPSMLPAWPRGARIWAARPGEFLDTYAAARGRPFSRGEWQRCWAAGVWTRAFDAKQEYAAGQPVTLLTRDEADERLRRAGMR